MLILNQSKKAMQISQKGTILAENNFLDKKLFTDGFVVYED